MVSGLFWLCLGFKVQSRSSGDAAVVVAAIVFLVLASVLLMHVAVVFRHNLLTCSSQRGERTVWLRVRKPHCGSEAGGTLSVKLVLTYLKRKFIGAASLSCHEHSPEEPFARPTLKPCRPCLEPYKALIKPKKTQCEPICTFEKTESVQAVSPKHWNPKPETLPRRHPKPSPPQSLGGRGRSPHCSGQRYARAQGWVKT